MEFLKERLIGSHIVDVTEQFVGNGLIVTGVRKPGDSHEACVPVWICSRLEIISKLLILLTKVFAVEDSSVLPQCKLTVT
jgi:hypothetical protein